VVELLRETRDDLRRLANYKEQFIVRRTIEKGKKVRQLAYPQGRLRAVHELLKFHLNKVKQPSYLFSPRKGRSQRDNAELHLGQDQFLSFDLKQFYPSTTASMVRNWLVEELQMYPDVAGLITCLVTVDEAVSFGSPLTPVLCTLIHRKMFDQIADLCAARHLRHSVWVDDVTISGRFVPGEFLESVHNVVSQHGLKTHKIKFQSGSRPVFVTGVGVLGGKLITPRKINEELKALFSQYHGAQTLEEREDCAQKLLSRLGTARFIAGKDSLRGRKAAGQMNTIKQELAAFRNFNLPIQKHRSVNRLDASDPPPFDL
jgi:RNA-directed DNA polymerase